MTIIVFFKTQVKMLASTEIAVWEQCSTTDQKVVLGYGRRLQDGFDSAFNNEERNILQRTWYRYETRKGHFARTGF